MLEFNLEGFADVSAADGANDTRIRVDFSRVFIAVPMLCPHVWAMTTLRYTVGLRWEGILILGIIAREEEAPSSVKSLIGYYCTYS